MKTILNLVPKSESPAVFSCIRKQYGVDQYLAPNFTRYFQV